MLKYNSDRTREVLMALNTCGRDTVRMYQTLEFLRDPFSSESHNLSMAKIAEHANVSRRKIYDALDELVEKGLIEVIKLKKRGMYRFNFLMLKAEVVKMPQPEEPVRQYTEEELVEARKQVPF